MLRKCSLFVGLVFLLNIVAISGAAAGVQAAPEVPVLCYHDIGNPRGNPYTVTKERLREHFEWLKTNGFQPISVEEYLKAKQGLAILPDKAVMLTFDDGYLSFYTDVYPLLKEYKYPAVLAVVTSWLQTEPPAGIGPLVTWEQMREMEQSGLVTIASHTHDLHRYVPANPDGDLGQAVSTFIYKDGSYESEASYRQRIAADLELAQRELSSHLGHPSRVLVWPYGEYTQIAIDEAYKKGFQLLFTLENNGATALHGELGVRRMIVYNNPAAEKIAPYIQTGKIEQPLRVGQLDIDLIYDASPAQMAENLETAIAYLRQAKINTVILQAFADEQGTGNIQQLYFYTSAAPVKKDVLNHIIQRLHREKFQVYAWMPTLAGQWLLAGHPEDEVAAWDSKNKGWYRRATPFSPRVAAELKKVFRDLAAYNPIDGILFQDDLYLNDYEDFSPAAKAAFREKFNRELTPAALNDPQVRQEWINLKVQAMNKLMAELMDEVRRYRPQAKFARNIYPSAVLNPEAKAWLAQDYAAFFQLYDYAVIMCYPALEKVPKPERWLADLAQAALAYPGAAERTVFKLQAYDWEKKRWIAPPVLKNKWQY